MKKLRLEELIGEKKRFKEDEIRAISNLPEIYLCDSTEDLSDNLNKIEGRYSTIILPAVTLEPIYTEEGNLIRYMMDDGGSCISFQAYDSRDSRHVLWPEVDRENINPDMMKKFLERPQKLDGVFLCYDSMYDNAFLMHLLDSYKQGVERIMGEIWSES